MVTMLKSLADTFDCLDTRACEEFFRDVVTKVAEDHLLRLVEGQNTRQGDWSCLFDDGTCHEDRDGLFLGQPAYAVRVIMGSGDQEAIAKLRSFLKQCIQPDQSYKPIDFYKDLYYIAMDVVTVAVQLRLLGSGINPIRLVEIDWNFADRQHPPSDEVLLASVIDATTRRIGSDGDGH